VTIITHCMYSFSLLALPRQCLPICQSLKCQSFFQNYTATSVEKPLFSCVDAPVLFLSFFPTRSETPLLPSHTLHMVRLWRSVEVIFVSSLFCSFFCSQLRRTRIKAPHGTLTWTPLMPSIACHRQRFNPLPRRDPTSNRKQN
jgi:hypothetical protein